MVYVEQTTGYFTKEKGVHSQGLAVYIKHKHIQFVHDVRCTRSNAVNPHIVLVLVFHRVGAGSEEARDNSQFEALLF